MANEESIFEISGVCEGNSIKGNFDVELRMLFTEKNLFKALQFVAAIGNHVSMIAKIENGEKVKLGTWSVYRLTVDRNAQTKVIFKSNMAAANHEALSHLFTDEEGTITLKVKIEPNE